MSEQNNLQKNDELREKFAGIDRMVSAPANLVEAAKKGEVIASAGNRYTAGFHVRKFVKAAVAYAVGVTLLLGALLLLPQLLSENPPVVNLPKDTTSTTSHTSPITPSYPDKLLKPSKLVDKILTEYKYNVAITNRAAYLLEDGRTLDYTLLLIREGNRIYYKNELIDSAGEANALQEYYYDIDALVAYSNKEDVWVKETSESISWEALCNTHIFDDFFEDAYYELVDGVYTVTNKGLDLYFGEVDNLAEQYYGKMVWDYSLQNDIYTFRRIIRADDGREDINIRLEISFGNASLVPYQSSENICSYSSQSKKTTE